MSDILGEFFRFNIDSLIGVSSKLNFIENCTPPELLSSNNGTTYGKHDSA